MSGRRRKRRGRRRSICEGRRKRRRSICVGEKEEEEKRETEARAGEKKHM